MARHAAAPAGRPVRKFRPEIEGLRAVAATLVAVYHIYLGKVSGGVDVFFLVAGFLITTSLLGQVMRAGRIDAAAYLSRLMKRLLPGALTVLAVVLTATLVWMPVTRVSATLSEVAASALYYENWALAAKSVDYLAREEAQSPVQHFWAMSIQGQFYVLWLGVFAVALWWGRRRLRASLTIVLVLTFAASFLYSVYLTTENQPLAYFHTGTRVWEFALGGLLAVGITQLPRFPEALNVVGGWVGLVMIVSTGLVLPVSNAFPGWVALWPIIGATLTILCGDSHSRWSAGRLLSSRPLVYLGGISYGIYLWHWPLLTFYLLRSGQPSADLLPGLGIIAASLILAVLTTRFIEQPIRSRSFVRPWRATVAGATSLAVLATTAFAVNAQSTGPLPEIAPGDPNYPGAISMEAGFTYRGEDDVELSPALLAAKADLTQAHADGCHQDLADPELVLCQYGDPDGDFSVMLIGGSHSTHWFPAVEEVATARGWRVTTALKAGCLFSDTPLGSGASAESCAAWNEAALEEVLTEEPDLLITTATRGVGSGEAVVSGSLGRWRTLEAAGIRVAAIRDTPRWDEDRVDCLAGDGNDSARCDPLRADLLAEAAPWTSLRNPPTNVTFLDLTDQFCDAVRCPAVIGNVLVYRDKDHLTSTYARTLAPALDRALVEAGLVQAGVSS